MSDSLSDQLARRVESATKQAMSETEAQRNRNGQQLPLPTGNANDSAPACPLDVGVGGAIGGAMSDVSDQAIPDAPRYLVTADGRVVSMVYGWRKPIAPRPDKDGYLRVTVWIDGKRKWRAVHTLVATAFHGPPPFKGAEVRHLDGDVTNNDASNLRWGTHAENMVDRRGHGNNAVGERNGRATITGATAAQIKRMLRERVAWREIGRRLGVSEGVISGIAVGNWRHVA